MYVCMYVLYYTTLPTPTPKPTQKKHTYNRLGNPRFKASDAHKETYVMGLGWGSINFDNFGTYYIVYSVYYILYTIYYIFIL